MSADPTSGRLAELAVALSLASDLGTGQPMEHGLRTCWLSAVVAEQLGLDPQARSVVYYAALLRFVGCTSDASETAALVGGDELAFNAVMAPMFMAGRGQRTRWFVRHVARSQPLPRRAARVAGALADPAGERRSLTAHCEVGVRLATRLGMADGVREALAHAYERWDGRGLPAGLAEEAIPLAVRIATAARDAEMWARQAGWPAAADVLTRRRGRAYDPVVVDVLVSEGRRWLSEVGDDVCASVLAAEPPPVVTVTSQGVDAALSALGDITDLTSPSLRSHSSGVAALAEVAARASGMDDEQVRTVRRAALVHDVGRIGVPSGIWERRGPLTADQWERVRLHPYLTERVLRRCGFATTLADVAGRHHERGDGSGYHRGDTGDGLSRAARLLGTVDAYHAMTEDRPHRPALTPAAAVAELRAQAADGRFSGADVDAVLAALDERPRRRSWQHPAGLTDREVEVLRLIARGQSNRQVASALVISPKTVGHHVEHIYAKTGVGTRAGATLFALEHGLLSR